MGRERRVVFSIYGIIVLISILIISIPEAQALEFILEDENAEVHIKVDNPLGLNFWEVDSTGNIFQQSFWIRIGSGEGAREFSITDIFTRGAAVTTDTDGDGFPDTLSVEYSDRECLTVEITWALTGGSTGSGSSTIFEKIEITNECEELPISFFQYSDFDLAGDFFDDTTEFLNPVTMLQTDSLSDSPSSLSETVVSPTPDHHEVGFFSSILSKLNDSSATVLNDSNGPISGDGTWAFQWDFIIGEGGTFTIQKCKRIGPVDSGLTGNSGCIPEPSTSKGGGGPWEAPSLGPDSGGIVKHNNGICINITCWDVTQNYHVDFELYEMLTGSNTISLTIWCPHGVATCDYVGLGITPPNESTSSSIWSIAIEKDSSGEWKLKKDDSEGRLGNITFSVQEIGNQFLSVSFSIDFKNLSTDKCWLWVELRDTNRGVNLFFFNDGVKFIDNDAYPEVATAFEPSLKLKPICLDEDPDYRNSCAFAKKRERAIQNAEEVLMQIMNNEYTYK